MCAIDKLTISTFTTVNVLRHQRVDVWKNPEAPSSGWTQQTSVIWTNSRVGSCSRATSSRGTSTTLTHVSLPGVVIRVRQPWQGGIHLLIHSFILSPDRGWYFKWTRQTTICCADASSSHIWVTHVPSSHVSRPAVTSSQWVCSAALVSTTRALWCLCS